MMLFDPAKNLVVPSSFRVTAAPWQVLWKTVVPASAAEGAPFIPLRDGTMFAQLVSTPRIVGSASDARPRSLTSICPSVRSRRSGRKSIVIDVEVHDVINLYIVVPVR